MGSEENRFRLRLDAQIVGYQRQLGKSLFYSKDGHAWGGNTIDFNFMDACTNRKDKNDQMIYSGDILQWTADDKDHFVEIQFDEALNLFQAVDLDTEEIVVDFFLPSGFNPSVKRISFSFVQPV